jgi:acyl-coenzyme A thioesterase PaaI-like protein
MDMTELARRLLEPIPAHRTAGIEVLRVADGAAEIASQTPQALTNVIGSLHSSGLAALVDTAGLGAIIAPDSPHSGFEGIVPLGRAASMQFLAPARWRLVATCRLTDETRNALRPLWSGRLIGHGSRPMRR